MLRYLVLLLVVSLTAGCRSFDKKNQRADIPVPLLQVSENGRFLQCKNGEPFFWMGDTGWLLFQKLSREEANIYLQDRCDKGFNVIQVMAIHELPETNYYGDTALLDKDPMQPNTTPGCNFDDPDAYDYWDHVDYVVELAAEKGLYIAMVPMWGGAVKKHMENRRQASVYCSWLAGRYKDCPNIIWLNGGDIRGDVKPEIWQQFGESLRQTTPHQLISFHPRGRTQSSTWFHHAEWLDFNMFQSGHRRYDQIRETDDPEKWKGEDNWKYVAEDYALKPVKPTLDGEPSYENIPQGLHDPNEPYWTAADARRYAYWAVFAGAFGHTYGNNAVIQMHKPNDDTGSYGVRNFWFEAIDDPGAGQMHYLKDLILSRPFFERVPDQSLLSGNTGEKYDYVIATRGTTYALFYTCTGRSFDVVMGKISGEQVKASWFNPRNGEITYAGQLGNSDIRQFDPPGEEQAGNDWVLILDSVN